MALTVGTGPFGEKGGGTFNFDTSVLKAHTLYFEDCPKRVRAIFGGETVADSRRVKILHETGHLPVYYFPEEDLNHDLLEESGHTTYCPFSAYPKTGKIDPKCISGREGVVLAEGCPEPSLGP